MPEWRVPATGFRVFTAGAGYFHEGMSLEECLVPVVVLEVRSGGVRPPGGTTSRRRLSYKKAQFNASHLHRQA